MVVAGWNAPNWFGIPEGNRLNRLMKNNIDISQTEKACLQVKMMGLALLSWTKTHLPGLFATSLAT